MLDTDEWEVPFWLILERALSTEVTDCEGLVDLLQTVDVTLRGKATTDYGFLESFLKDKGSVEERQFFGNTWPVLVDLALDMPRLFPEGSLPVLSEQNCEVVLSRRQIACLVVHQFLCSLPSQSWVTDSSPDFRIWYSGDSRHPEIITAYLSALFVYFDRLAGHGSDSPCPPLLSAEWLVTFTLRALGKHPDDIIQSLPMECALIPMTITCQSTISTAPALLGLPDGACVISANKNVGFGQTATQEEMHVGTSPESCPIVLLCPTLQDTQVLIVKGAEAMVIVDGYGRKAQMRGATPKDLLRGVPFSQWQRRTMLFMDALELDMYDSLPDGIVADLLPGNVDRELTKAYTAFSSSISMQRSGGLLSSYSRIITGLWGCGAFGGNREIKTVLQWCAASLAGVKLHFVCSGDAQREFADRLGQLMRAVLASDAWSVGRVRDLLVSLDPSDANARDVFSYLRASLSSGDADMDRAVGGFF